MQDSVIKLGNIGFRTLGFFSSSSWPLCSLKIPRVQEWMAPSVPLGNCLQLYQKLGKRKRQKSYCSNVHKEQIIVFHTPTLVLVIRKRNKTSKVFFHLLSRQFTAQYSTVTDLITIQHTINILGVTTAYYLSFLNFQTFFDAYLSIKTSPFACVCSRIFKIIERVRKTCYIIIFQTLFSGLKRYLQAFKGHQNTF